MIKQLEKVQTHMIQAIVLTQSITKIYTSIWGL